MDAQAVKRVEMTVEGFTSYLAKYDQKARIMFMVSGAPDYAPAKEATHFTEKVIDAGNGTMLIVGLE